MNMARLIEVATDSRYPGYALIEAGDAHIPVMVRDGGDNPATVIDCFTSGPTSVTAFYDEDEAWEFIARDYESMRGIANRRSRGSSSS
jgi:hypothetical protein